MTQTITTHVGIGDVAGNSLAFGQQLAAVSLPVVLPALQMPAGLDSFGSFKVGHAKTKKIVSGSFAADVDALVAAVSAKRIKVTALNLFTFGTSATTVIFKSAGTGGTELWRVCLQSAASNVMGVALCGQAPDYLFGTVAGERLTADTNTTDTVHYSLSYYDDDAT